MGFRALLQKLVESVPGADSAVFMDWEGEAVELFSRNENAEHVKFIGAHHGLLLDSVKRAGESAQLGEPQTIVIKSEKTDYITAPVHDGYYLVLCVEAGRPLARANIAIDRTVRELRREMGY